MAKRPVAHPPFGFNRMLITKDAKTPLIIRDLRPCVKVLKGACLFLGYSVHPRGVAGKIGDSTRFKNSVEAQNPHVAVLHTLLQASSGSHSLVVTSFNLPNRRTRKSLIWGRNRVLATDKSQVKCAWDHA